METNDVIVFENLRQATATLGVYEQVKAKATSFAQPNAAGLIRECDRPAVGALAAASAKKARQLLGMA